MSDTNVLKSSVFPINDNLRAIEQSAVGKYPFVFLLEPKTTDKLLKLNANLKALGKDPIDTNQIINAALSKALDGLINEHKHPHDYEEYYVPHHYLHPQPGDWWNERLIGYCVVHEVFDDNDFVVHLMMDKGGLEQGLYRINRTWLARIVAYDWKELLAKEEKDLGRKDFCAWVLRGSEKSPEKEANRANWYEEHKGEVKDIRHFAPTK